MVPTAGNVNNGTGIFALGGAHLSVTGLNTFNDNHIEYGTVHIKELYIFMGTHMVV